MPKRKDIKSILILGAGPIIIGQACEFDYSGVQACKALREEGYRIILVNSNPATIMTDPEISDATYIEPIHYTVVRNIIKKEVPDAILPTMGGQTALNCALELERKGILKNFGVTMIGTTKKTIIQAENRCKFDDSMKKIGLSTARSGIAHSMSEAFTVLDQIGYPCIIRPSFTMGGNGGGIAYNIKEFEELCERGLYLSPTNELLIDESLMGWKEYEMEVVRDRIDNCIIVCSIENFDGMGIHTGDSITVAPAQTLTDKEYQIMRNSSMEVLREIGVENGGSNVQFSVHKKTGKMMVIEMNPRVSRSSALASKATGFPIAKIAAKLSIGYTLDELMNDITGNSTPASFEPSIDYVVTKIPRFHFEKFSGANDRLTTQMKSVGEVMAIGRTQQESLQKSFRGLEVFDPGLYQKVNFNDPESLNKIRKELKFAGSDRIFYIADAFRAGFSVDYVVHMTKIENWFLVQMEELIILEEKFSYLGISHFHSEFFRTLKRKGFSDERLAKLANVEEGKIRTLRHCHGLFPVYKRVDTCAAEFFTHTAYMYSTYEEECEVNPHNDCPKIMVLGGGPNRIGQGIEFDYCCVHASLAMREDGYETIMVNCNPETVSTDYDISDRLYFESITLEDVIEIVRVEKLQGVIVQYGGQTPLKLACELELTGIPVIGTSPESIDCAEDREIFKKAINRVGLKQPNNVTVLTVEQAVEKAKKIRYPIVIRPSYVLGGRAMEIIYNEIDLQLYFNKVISASLYDYPFLLDGFLDDAIEVDVDAIYDGKNIFICGIMEHIEQAGIHSGDSSCSIPVYTLSKEIQDDICNHMEKISLELQVRGVINVQFAIKDKKLYLIEVNPRAARTIPFVSKSIGIPFAKISIRVMLGKSLASQGMIKKIIPPYYSVKEVVLPFNKFPAVDPILGPEMRSTGEVMGIGSTFSNAFSKAMLSSQSCRKKIGRVLLSVRKKDKARVVDLAIILIKKGFQLDATHGTAVTLSKSGINTRLVNNVYEGRPHIKDRIKNGEYTYIVHTCSGRYAIKYSKIIRRCALQYKVHYDTTLNGSFANLISFHSDPKDIVISIQKMHTYILG